MDFFSHFVYGILTAILILPTENPVLITFAGFMAVLPDFDVLLLPLQRWSRSYYFVHRGGSHSLITALIVAILPALYLRMTTSINFWIAWLIGGAFYSLHLILDTLTTYRTPLLYPLSKKEIKLNIERAVNPVLMVFSMVFTGYYLIKSITTSILPLYALYPCAITYFAYLIYRIINKVVVDSRGLPNTFYLPGYLPFIYYLFQQEQTDHTNHYGLSKKILFRNPQLMVESTIPLDGVEQEWIKLAHTYARPMAHYVKWEFVIPRVEISEATVHVNLYWTEAYFFGRILGIHVEFDRTTKAVKTIHQTHLQIG